MDLPSIADYLKQKGIEFTESNGELKTRCIFSVCDNNSRPGEAHLYFSAETGQYHCKKCDASGNLITLAKHFNEALENMGTEQNATRNKKVGRSKKFDPNLVDVCHEAITDDIKQYLSSRGIKESLVSHYKLGWSEFYGVRWITIPIKDKDGDYTFFKLRRDPNAPDEGDKYKSYPTGNSATLFGWDMLKNNDDMVVVCEGELDAILLSSFGIPAISSTAGANTFKEEWTGHMKKLRKVYVCFDKDEAGLKGSEKVIELLDKNLPGAAIYKITFPDRMTEGKDITDYFTKYNGSPQELINQCAKQVAGRQPIDTSKFKPIRSEELASILGLTIKKDDANKLIAFLCTLSAYTEQSQFNLSFNAPSSTGKSFIPMEISSLFPADDVMKLGNCSPTAFFHEQGEYDKEKNTILVDLSRKILIFLDQPNTGLLERLRSLLSHDQKEMISKITDKNQKGGNRTKTVILRGYPSVIFCSAGLKIDEQESTRFILLSPQTDQEKLRFSIQERIKREADFKSYGDQLNANTERQLLKERIEAIKDERIDEITIANPELIETDFFATRPTLKPRHQRDVGRIMTLTKVFALLNVWHREREGSTIIATNEDFQEALNLWNQISESQEHNLPPYIYELFKDIIIPAYEHKNLFSMPDMKIGVERKDILQTHFRIYKRMIQDWQLRQQILPMLEAAGLIIQEPDPDDKRKILITPTTQINTSAEPEEAEDIVSEDVGL